MMRNGGNGRVHSGFPGAVFCGWANADAPRAMTSVSFRSMMYGSATFLSWESYAPGRDTQHFLLAMIARLLGGAPSE